MQLKSFLLLCAFSVLGLSCKKDDDDSGGGGPEYVDQVLKGTIAGKKWTFKTGHSIEEEGDDKVSFDFTSEEIENPCENFGISQAKDKIDIFFSWDPADIEKEDVELKLSFGGEDSRTVTMYDGDEKVNHVASDGKATFTKITASSLKGRLVASIGDNSINGNFELTRCCGEKDAFEHTVCAR